MSELDLVINLSTSFGVVLALFLLIFHAAQHGNDHWPMVQFSWLVPDSPRLQGHQGDGEAP